MNLKEIEFLEGIANDLVLHANKNGSKLKEFVEVQKEKHKKKVERSYRAVYEGRKKNKLYGRSKKQLAYQKQVKIMENDNNFDDLK